MVNGADEEGDGGQVKGLGGGWGSYTFAEPYFGGLRRGGWLRLGRFRTLGLRFGVNWGISPRVKMVQLGTKTRPEESVQ
jgi:hypothetical protein